MSVNMDADGTDYSDFEYQTAALRTQVTPDDSVSTNPRARTVTSFEPLARIGGLDNNEVAELVYLETFADIEIEDEEVADQDVATTGELRGAVGINLPASDSAFPESADVGFRGEVVEAANIPEDNVTTRGNSRSDDRILQQYFSGFGLPFDDQTNGPGGSGTYNHFYAEKSYRSLTGRGPVLDANDDLSVSAAVNVSDSIIPIASNTRIHCVWDVAETSDAGRRFSVPM